MPNNPARGGARCPLCGEARSPEYRPFCSRGCRDRDLNRWFDEDYRVAADEPPASESWGDESE